MTDNTVDSEREAQWTYTRNNRFHDGTQRKDARMNSFWPLLFDEVETEAAFSVSSRSDRATNELTYQRILHSTLIEVQSVLLQYNKSESKNDAEKIFEEELRKLVGNNYFTPSDKYMTAYQQLANRMMSELKSSISQPSKEDEMTFWQWTTQQRPPWYKNADEAIITVVLFVMTLRMSAFITSLITSYLLGIHGTLVDGPHSFRVLSLLCFALVFAVLLAIIGTLGGRHGMSMKILDRFVSLSYAFISMLVGKGEVGG